MKHLNFARLLALALAFALFYPCAPTYAAGRLTGDPDVAARIPHATAQWRGLHAGPSEVHLGGGSTHVTLRPATTTRTFEAARRISAPGAEGLLLESAAAGQHISFQLTDTAGIAVVASEGRGVRFVSNGPARDVVLAAPVVLGADGRPSVGARWSVERNGSGSTAIRLVITDRSIVYPATAMWSTSGRTHVKSNALELGTGSISGQILTTAGSPVAEALLLLFDSNGEYMDVAYSDVRGGYSFTGLGTGSYRVLLLADGYEYQLYHDIPCPDGDCNYAAGTPIDVRDTVDTPGVDFRVANQRTLLSGTITDRSGNPLEGVQVVVYEGDGTPHVFALTNAAGVYHAELRVGGAYYARTFNSIYAGAVDQVYSGIDCTTCDVTAGTAIRIATGEEQGGIDFSLRTDGGRIAGHVTDEVSGRGLPDRTVTIYNAAGEPVSYGVTAEDGSFISFNGLVDGTYYAAVETTGYTPEVYKDHACTRCSVTSGTPISVSRGATVDSVDFSLSQTKIYISGTVRAAGTREALASVTVSAYDEAGHLAQAAKTNEDGTYVLFVDEPGDYYVRTDSRDRSGYVDQLYAGVDCSGCRVTGGTAVGTEPNRPAEGIDFLLANDGGSITGTLSNGRTTVAAGFVLIYSATGELASEGFSDANGNYTLDRGLTTGSYYAVAFAEGYEPMLYGGGFCTNCDPTTGTPISVTRGAITSGIDFTLNTTSAHITGHVTAGDTGNPLADVAVVIYDSTGTIVSSADTIADGSYDAFLPGAGTYYARTRNTENPGYADQLYSGIECVNCDPTTGTPITVNAGATTAGIDFALPVGCSPIDVAPAGVPNTSVGSAYSVAFTATGGTGAMTFAASEGTVPPGLTLNASTGVLSGTPTAAATYVFVIKATDSRGCSGEHEYTIVVARAVTQTSLSSSPAAPIFNQSITLTATVAPATATGNVVFREGATELATVAVSGGSASLSLGTRAPGTYVFTASYSGDDNHDASTSATLTVVVSKATPVFSNLTAPTVIIGTATTTLGGKLTAGALVPSGTVAITLNGVTQNATIQADGSFSASFNTSALTPRSTGYTVTYAYAGSTNFNPANATTLLTVTYGFSGGPISNGTDPVAFRVKLLNAAGVNISSASITVTAYGVRLAGTTAWQPVASTGNQGLDLKFQNADDGSYKFNLAKGSRPAGTYELGFTVTNDPIVHFVTFTMP